MMDQQRALQHLLHLGRVARETRTSLLRALARGGSKLEGGREARLEVTLDHLGQVREGFVITLRTSSVKGWTELEALLEAILVDWSWLKPLGIRWTHSSEELEKPVSQVLSFAHASAAMGLMPRLPAREVTFPYPRRTYADIPIPASPGEMLSRIEEMESVIARGTSRPLCRMSRETVRRTYGYFETSAWLVSEHGRRFGWEGSTADP
jgi:hypothetical protein